MGVVCVIGCLSHYFTTKERVEPKQEHEDKLSLIDKEIMNIRTKPSLDNENLSPMCPNCSHSNALINAKGDFCTFCNAPFMRCALSFEILPLVEFKPKKEITSDQAIDFIKLGTVEKMKRNIKSISDFFDNNTTINEWKNIFDW